MSLLKSWMTSLGCHGKQVDAAGAVISISAQTASIRHRGEKDPDHVKRLAMVP